jgi:hypothetical protein
MKMPDMNPSTRSAGADPIADAFRRAQEHEQAADRARSDALRDPALTDPTNDPALYNIPPRR